VFNGPITVSAFAVDVFGNTSAAQNLDFTIQNRLVSQSWTSHLCWPSSGNCSNITPWQPVTTGVATEAATHLQGTVTYSSQRGLSASDFWLQVASANNVYYCGTDGATVDCYPPLTLLPNGAKSNSNYSGAQIDGISQKGSGSEQGDVQWTLTYPQ
jgi:hypothetical protein